MSLLASLCDLGMCSWLFVAAVILLTKWYVSNQKWPNSPPGPFSFPVIGSLLSIPDKDFRIALLKLRNTYGDIFRLDMGVQKTVVLNGYDVISEALLKHGDAFNNRPDVLLGTQFRKDHGLAATSGELWSKQRQFIVYTLRNFGMGKNTMERVVKEEIHNLLNEMSKYEGKPFDPFPWLSKGTSNLITTFVLNKRHDYTDPEFLESIRLQDIFNRVMNGGGILNFFPFLKDLPGDPLSYHELKNAELSLVELCKKWIEEKKVSLKEGDTPNDYVEAYLLKMKEDENNPDTVFTESQLAWNVSDLFAAGTDTTSTTVTYILLYMLLYPQVQEKVFAEIDSVVGSSRQPNLNDRASLPYTEAVISEVQRDAVIIPLGLPHAAVQDMTLRGYTIPKGINIYTNWYSILKDEKLWPDPDKFDPGRFLDSGGNFRKPHDITLFSLGKRNCVGESLARCEVFLFAVSILQRFKISLPEGDKVPSKKSTMGLVCHPEPFEITMEPRISTI